MVSNNQDYYMNPTHKYDALFNTRNNPGSTFLRDQTSVYNANKTSYTVDRYFNVSSDVHVGPSSNHYMIPKVKTVQGLNIIDSETVC